ncbi:Rod shape-determining protein MreD [hydrothermal vent metagenome]|uniref:Rod shape-determining protein MreD n=1 Tax=hydrothermal vent metagenome TaxID=652676 RepID=A0A3B0TPC4_9ZZZZ
MRIWIKYSVMFFSLLLVQVLLLNYVQFNGYINPYIYILFIMLLPISTPRDILLLLGFLMGLSVDIFSDTLGIHAASSVFLAFIRPYVIDLISARETDKSNYPGLKQYGFRWFLYYTVFLVVAHHLFFFYLEVFTLKGFIYTFFRSILSSVFSIFIIVLSQYLVFSE